jgi:hypothetical protein
MDKVGSNVNSNKKQRQGTRGGVLGRGGSAASIRAFFCLGPSACTLVDFLFKIGLVFEFILFKTSWGSFDTGWT